MVLSISLVGFTSFLSLLILSSTPVSANGLSGGKDLLVVRAAHNAHAGIAKRAVKRATNANSKRCKGMKNSSSTITSFSSTKSTKTKTSTKARATVTTKSGYGGGGGSAPAVPHSAKLGLVWAGSDDQIWGFAKGNHQLMYNWAVDPPSTAKAAGFNFMPMLWGRKNVSPGCEYQGGCFAKIKASDYNTVMFINEANEGGQANMGVSEAVGLWRKYMQPLANQGVRTVGPVMSSNPNGMVWTKQFYSQCSGCKVDIQPVHYYDITPEGMIEYMKKYHDLSNRPIMVTEWACQNFNEKWNQCSHDEIWNFNRKVISFMESTSWVVAYMPFGAMIGPLPDGVNNENLLMDYGGKPTSLAHLMGY